MACYTKQNSHFGAYNISKMTYSPFGTEIEISGSQTNKS